MTWDELIDRIEEIAKERGVEKWGDEDKSVRGNYCTISVGDELLEIRRITEEEEDWIGEHSGEFEIV